LPISSGSGCRLKISDLAKTWDRRPVFEDLGFEVRSGQALTVTGPNGAGKSTLLRLLAGLARPSAGRIEMWIDGRLLDAAGRRGAVGYVAPDVSPYDELSALENLELIGRIRGIPAEAARAGEILDRVGLAARAAPAGTLSTGQKQRLKVGLALLGRPRALLLDEPGSNLDGGGRAMLDRVIEEAMRHGPVIIATNDPEEFRFGEHRLHLDPVGGANPRHP
jgi:ABC-type multidrug transport system ATPase subunit